MPRPRRPQPKDRPPPPTVPGWFLPLLASAKKKAGSRLALAEGLGVAYSSVAQWEKGAAPSLDLFDALMRYVGGDLGRALPDYVAADAPGPTVVIAGHVQAGAVTLSDEFIDERPINPAIWRRSRLWSATTGPVVHLLAMGTSMHPRYRDGAIVACREPLNPLDLEDGTPCVFQTVDGHTLKILERADDGTVIGDPINRADGHKPIVFPRRADVRIAYVVLGHIDADEESLPMGNPKPRKIRERLAA